MKRPEILLVNPWIHDFAAYDLWARPMGLLVLATWLRRAGWEPRLVDCLDHDHPDAARLKSRAHGQGRFQRTPITKPDSLSHVPRTFSRYGVDPEAIRRDLISMPSPVAILVTSLMTYWYPGVRETIGLLRECFPGVPLLMGGIYASLMPEHARAHCLPDEVIAGPGEAALPEALYRLTGVRSREESHGPALEFSGALDLMRKVRFLPILTSRGCPFSCSYCASRRLVSVFGRRAAPQVVREIVEAAERYGVCDVALYDDAFLLNAHDYAIPLLDAITERVPGLQWHTPNGLHASAIDSEVASALKRAGFQTIRIGLESTSDEFHAATGGKTDRRSFLNAVRHLKEAGFSGDRIGAYLLVGLPGQSRVRIEDDVDLVLSAGALPKLAEYSPIPGTKMWQEALRFSRYPIDREPLFHNCTLLPAAEPEVDSAFLQATRRRIRDYTQSAGESNRPDEQPGSREC